MKLCWVIVLFALVLSAQARLPRKSSSSAAGTTGSSPETEQPQADRNPKAQSGIGGSEEGSSPGEDSDEEEHPLFLRRERNPFSLLESLLNMHLGNGRNTPSTSVIRIQPMSPSYNPFSFYPAIRHPSILGNNPFDLPSSFPEFPRFGHFPEIAHPSLFDLHDEKVPEGYEKVKESIEGPEGHQVIRTTYEKKNTEGPNQFYGVIVKMRPYKPEGSKSDVKPSSGGRSSADKPEGGSNEEDKKQADRRVAGERSPNHEVEESAVNSATEQPSKQEEKKTPSEDKPKEEAVKPSGSQPSTTGDSPAKKDAETIAPKDKPASENEIPKSDEAPTITVNDNNGSE